MNNSQALQLKRSVIMVSDLEKALSIYRDFWVLPKTIAR